MSIKPFELLHRSAIRSAVRQMDADGDTASYDGIAAVLSLLVQDKRGHPDVKPLVFVLTDGKTNRELDLGTQGLVIEAREISVDTIGFEADIEELGRFSALVEEASQNAAFGLITGKSQVNGWRSQLILGRP